MLAHGANFYINNMDASAEETADNANDDDDLDSSMTEEVDVDLVGGFRVESYH